MIYLDLILLLKLGIEYTPHVFIQCRNKNLFNVNLKTEHFGRILHNLTVYPYLLFIDNSHLKCWRSQLHLFHLLVQARVATQQGQYGCWRRWCLQVQVHCSAHLLPSLKSALVANTAHWRQDVSQKELSNAVTLPSLLTKVKLPFAFYHHFTVRN